MTKNKNLIYAIIVALILIVLFILSSPLHQSLISGECGIENCHGLDIICGRNVPDVCDTSYMAGDNCRRYAGCRLVDGRCELERSLKFDNCKACVKKCEQDFQDNQIKFFECESKCAK